MTTVEFITALFYEVDEQMRAMPKHPEAHLWPSEVVTLGLLHALKGVGNRAFYRWLTRDYRPLFPRLPERTRLFRLFRTHQDWTQVFLAAPTVLGVIDTYGIELIHPMREGRSSQQIGRKGLSNHRWIVQRPLQSPLDCWWQTVSPAQSVGVNRRLGVCHGQCAGQHLSGADSAVRRAHDCLERHGLPCCGGGSRQPQTVSARRVARPYARRDGALHADARLPFQEGDAPGMGVFSGAARVHHGRLQCVGPVAWFTAQRVWLRAPLDS